MRLVSVGENILGSVLFPDVGEETVEVGQEGGDDDEILSFQGDPEELENIEEISIDFGD